MRPYAPLNTPKQPYAALGCSLLGALHLPRHKRVQRRDLRAASTATAAAAAAAAAGATREQARQARERRLAPIGVWVSARRHAT